MILVNIFGEEMGGEELREKCGGEDKEWQEWTGTEIVREDGGTNPGMLIGCYICKWGLRKNITLRDRAGNAAGFVSGSRPPP